jgi:hypothetical protein
VWYDFRLEVIFAGYNRERQQLMPQQLPKMWLRCVIT